MVVNRLERYWDEPETADQTGESRMSPLPAVDSTPSRNKWMDTVGTMLADHPEATVVAAITMGVVLGWLIKRR